MSLRQLRFALGCAGILLGLVVLVSADDGPVSLFVTGPLMFFAGLFYLMSLDFRANKRKRD